MLSQESNCFGDVWLKAIDYVVKYGAWISDDCSLIRDITNIDEHGDIIYDDLWKRIQNHPNFDAKTKNISKLSLLEGGHLHFHISSLEKNDLILEKFADMRRIKYTIHRYGPDTKDGYGSRIYGNSGNYDQFTWVINQLKSKPETKSATFSIHTPGTKPACISLIDFKYRDNRLNISLVFRSQNLILKMPGNLLALRNLQESVAQKLGFQVGCIDLYVFSPHIYEVHYARAIEILKANLLWKDV